MSPYRGAYEVRNEGITMSEFEQSQNDSAQGTDSEVARKARAVLEESMQRRLDAATSVGEADRLLAQLRRNVEEAEQQFAATWKAAVEAGWDERELRSLGLTQTPTSKRSPRRGQSRQGRSNGDGKA